ncbi:MAG: tetratricopeptide repeat protein [Verrucomicrobiota bacterium]
MLRTLRTLRFSISSQLLIALVILVAGLGLSGCSQGSRKARHQAKADKAFDAGDYPQAEVEYLNLVSVDPTDAHAMARLGLIYLENGKMSRAFPFLKRAEELDGNNLQVRLKIGLLNAASGNHKAAREQALFILDKDPKYPEAPPLLAQSAKTAKDQETVRQRLDKLVTLIGPTVWTELAFGSLSVQAGKIGEAKAHIEKALALDPKCADAYYSLGTIQWLGNDLAGTERSFKQAAELSRPRSAHKLGYANFKFKTGALEAGKEVLTQVTQETPDYLPAWGSLAELALAQRNFEECTRLLNQIQARDPENYQAQVLGARLKLLQGRASEAIAVLELLTLRYPTAPQNFFQLGLAHLFTGDNAKALKYINEALALDPSYEDAILWQAQLNTQRGEAEAAIKSLQALIKRRPQLDDAYLKLAGAYAAKEDLSSAIATCRQLQNFHAESPNIPFVIGGFLLQQDKPKEARNEFLRARTLSSQFQPAFQQLVALDIHEKNFDAALNSVQKEIDLHPELPELRALRAQIWIAQTNHDEAEKDLRKALELNPNYRPAYMMLADLYVSSKRNEKALQELAAFVEKNPRDVPALMLMGMLNNERGNFSEARACYERLLEINPNFGIALNNLAYLYSEKFEMLDRAYETARKARDLAPYDPAASDTLGWILYKRGDYNWAASLLQASAEKLPDEPEVFYHLGMTYYMLNQEVRRAPLTRACGAKRTLRARTRPGNVWRCSRSTSPRADPRSPRRWKSVCRSRRMTQWR